MDTTPEKDQMLRTANFRYHFDRMAYVNRKAKKLVSVEAVEDHAEEWLRRMIAESNHSGQWQFYFDQPVSPDVIRAFLAELGISK